MKKLLCISGVVMSMLASSMSIFANNSAIEIENIAPTGAEVTVTGSIDGDSEHSVSLVILKEGAGLEQKGAVAMDEQKFAGTFAFTLEMPEIDSYNFVAYVQTENGDKDEYLFSYMSESKQKAFLDELYDAEDFSTKLSDPANEIAAKSCGIEIDVWKNLSGTMKVSVEKMVSSNKNKNDFVKIINQAICFEAFNAERNSAEAEKLFAKIGYAWQDTEFSAMDSARKSTVFNKMYDGIPYSDFVTSEKRFCEVNGLYDIGKAKTGELANILSKYADVLNYASDSNYLAYVRLSDKSAANDSIVTALYRSNPYTVSGLMSVIGTSLPSKGSSGGSGGGSGGLSGLNSGSSGAGSSVMAMAQLPAEESENPSVQMVTFSDLDEVEWAREAVESLAAEGILTGYEDGSFRPNSTVTREEFAAMIIRTAHLQYAEAFCDFDDVDRSQWYYPYIAAAYTQGLMSGNGDGTMGIGESIIRQDMAVIIYKTMLKKNIERDKATDVTFGDVEEISDYAAEAVTALAEREIIAGMDGNFVPHGYLTRAEAAKVLHSLFFVK